MRDNQLVIRVSVPQMALYMLAVIFVLEMRSVWTSITRFNRVNEILILAMVAVATLFILSRKQYTRHFINGIITSAVLCGYMFVYYFVLLSGMAYTAGFIFFSLFAYLKKNGFSAYAGLFLRGAAGREEV